MSDSDSKRPKKETPEPIVSDKPDKPRTVLRDANGRIQKGSAGLPNAGRPAQAIKNLAEYGRIITEGGTRAIWNLWQIAQDPKVKPADRISATNAVLDRTIGKAVDIQVLMNVNGDQGAKDALAAVSTAALEALLTKLGTPQRASESVVDAEPIDPPTDGEPTEPTDG